MQGLRRSSDNRQASDSLAQLTLNKRGVQLVGSKEQGAKKAVQNATAATKTAATAGRGVGAATTALSSQRDSNEQTVDLSRDILARAAQTVGENTVRGTATVVRGGATLAGQRVKGGIVAAQKRVAARQAAKGVKVTTEGAMTAGRAAVALARGSAAAAALLKGVVAAVVTAASSTPVLAIVSGTLLAVTALLSIITIPLTTQDEAPSTVEPPAIVSADGWTQPAAGPITSGYGMRRDPVTGSFTKLHAATDFAGGGEGSPIWAAQAGIVTQATNQLDNNGAWLIEVSHGSGITTRYWHMWADGVLVNVGDEVAAGQQIGEVGSSGWSTGPHLHFQVLINGTPVDPETFMSDQGITLQ